MVNLMVLSYEYDMYMYASLGPMTPSIMWDWSTRNWEWDKYYQYSKLLLTHRHYLDSFRIIKPLVWSALESISFLLHIHFDIIVFNCNSSLVHELHGLCCTSIPDKEENDRGEVKRKKENRRKTELYQKGMVMRQKWKSKREMGRERKGDTGFVHVL